MTLGEPGPLCRLCSSTSSIGLATEAEVVITSVKVGALGRDAVREWEKAHVWWLDEAPDLRALAQRIAQQASNGEPMFVFSRSGDLALLQQVDTLKQVMGY